MLHYWANPDRERKLFFCQREALETAIYLTEAASHFGDAWIENELRKANADFNGGLPRLAMKMATGSGKTVVMAVLIAWQTLNKLEDKQDRRFSDAFLIVTPGITIRARLRVLLPTDPRNYYRERDIVPGDMLERLGQARIVVTNYHGFLPRTRGEEARVWMSGLEAVHKKLGIRAVDDLSETPFGALLRLDRPYEKGPKRPGRVHSTCPERRRAECVLVDDRIDPLDTQAG